MATVSRLRLCSIPLTTLATLRHCSKLSADDPVDRTRAATADQKIDRGRKYEQRIFAAALGPEKSADIPCEIHRVDHEDCDGERCGAREQPNGQQDTAVNSVNPTTVPQNIPGLYPNRSKSWALAAKPIPPNQPKSFWHPCGMRIPPAVTRRMGAAQQLNFA
jgi:hypothetical protein